MSRRIAKTLGLFDLMKMYPTETDAVRYLESLRWGEKPRCVHCGATDKITAQKKAGDYWCGWCRHYFTVRSDTPLERCKIDLRKFIYAAYLLMTSRKGISSLQLSKELSVQQRTAWYILHRLRVACGGKLEPLRGTVEVDEVYLGGREANKHESRKAHGGHFAEKQIVLGMRERGGRAVALPIERADKPTLQGAVHRHVQPGTTICTDENPSYHGVARRHRAVNHSAKEYVNGMAHTNGIESVWAVLKRGFDGVYHNWSRKHCRQYVNEFMFRLNEGNCERDTQDRLDDLFRAMMGKTITYEDLTASGEGW